MKKEEIVMGLYAMRLQGKNRVAQERNNTVDRAVELINQLDEPEKVVIPKFVADHIQMQKGLDESLLRALGLIKLSGTELINWINQDGNDELFCRAWLDEKYEVSQKFDVKEGDWVIGRDKNSHDIRVVEACDIDVEDEFAGILLVNGIEDEYYCISELDEFYKKYRLFVKKENLEVTE